MKKIFYLIQIGVVALMFSTSAFADRDWGDHHGWGGHHGWGHRGWGGHHGHHGWGRPVVNNYYPQPQYYAPPPVYYAPPQPQYYQQPQYYDNRSHQGLAGGVLGTVFGYELGNGHPLAAGVGAAAGSYLGNGMGWRY
jgi:hypothetical protein